MVIESDELWGVHFLSSIAHLPKEVNSFSCRTVEFQRAKLLTISQTPMKLYPTGQSNISHHAGSRGNRSP